MGGQLLQNGKQSFSDVNGRPLVGGRVFFYSPGTQNLRDTWQDAALTVLNTNPVILDARGEASIYGSGAYRQVVRDAAGVLIWDQLLPDPLKNTAANIDYVYPDGITRALSTLATKNNPLLGSSGIAHDNGTVRDALLALDADVAGVVSQQGMPLGGGAASLFMGGRGFSKVLMLGDSNSAGSGQAEGFYGGLMGRVSRSIMNHFDRGVGMQRGFGYATLMNPYQELVETFNGWTGSFPGGFVAGGATGSLGKMVAGDYVQFTGREIAQVNFGFDAGLSAGATWQITVDGEFASGGTVTTSGRTGDTVLVSGPEYIRTDSAVRFTVMSGTLYYQHGQTIRAGGAGNLWGPLVWCAPEGSQGFSDFATPARINAIAPHVNAYPGPTLLIDLLGTNNFIDTVGKQLTPAAYITALDAQLATWGAALTSGENFYAVWVPPRPDLVLPLAPYEDYVRALTQYAAPRPHILLIRMDLTILGRPEGAIYYSPDKLHLATAGHAVAAQSICAALGIPTDAYFPFLPVAMGSTYGRGQKAVALASTWTGSGVTERLFDGSGRFTATVTKPAGGGAAAFCQVRANTAPSAPRPIFGLDQNGAFVPCVLGTDRNVTVQGSVAFVNAITSLNIDCRYTI